MALGEVLDSLIRRVQGCDAAAVVGLDGMAIEQRSPAGDVNLEQISAEQTSLLRGALAARREADTGSPSELILRTDRHQFLSRVLGEDYFLLLVLRPDASLGRARFEAVRAGVLLEEELR